MIPKPPTRSLLPEAFIWLGGLIILGIIAYLPDISSVLQLSSAPPGSLQLPSACLSQAVGLGECPGCGLGASIGHVFHGEVAASWQAHPMGIVVLGVLVGRIATLIIHSRKS